MKNTANNSNRTATATTTATTATTTAKTTLHNTQKVSKDAQQLLKEASRVTRADSNYEYAKQQMIEKKVEHFYFSEDNTTTFYKDKAQVVQFDFARFDNHVANRVQVHYRNNNVHIYVGENTMIDTSVVNAYEHHCDNVHERMFVVNDDIARAFIDSMIAQYATVTDSAKKDSKRTSAKKTSAKSAKKDSKTA